MRNIISSLSCLFSFLSSLFSLNILLELASVNNNDNIAGTAINAPLMIVLIVVTSILFIFGFSCIKDKCKNNRESQVYLSKDLKQDLKQLIKSTIEENLTEELHQKSPTGEKINIVKVPIAERLESYRESFDLLQKENIKLLEKIKEYESKEKV